MSAVNVGAQSSSMRNRGTVKHSFVEISNPVNEAAEVTGRFGNRGNTSVL
jgi:hypothetical protein